MLQNKMITGGAAQEIMTATSAEVGVEFVKWWLTGINKRNTRLASKYKEENE